MKIEFTKRFQKEFRQFKNLPNFAKLVDKSINNVMVANSVSEIKNIKRLTGFTDYYRIRIGDYRIGIKLDKLTIIFSTINHRKDIYKKFP